MTERYLSPKLKASKFSLTIISGFTASGFESIREINIFFGVELTSGTLENGRVLNKFQHPEVIKKLATFLEFISKSLSIS